MALDLTRNSPTGLYDSDMTESKAMILGCSGLSLTPEEKAFYKAERPWGFILFGRNISEPAANRRSRRRNARKRRLARAGAD